ncbi:hypothetical protein C2S52_016245 [Perilla frutescens var. hirtella]|nr:hypothetical protein C2S52_016245 [Perilla frutescens var. hirtella]
MVSSDKNLANVVGGKSARACDNCVRKRARWYCAADDAFLCQSCDSSVHSANPLARRHERVRLKSLSTFNERSRAGHNQLRISVPSWHRGFTRKARTPRKNKHAKYGVSADGTDGPVGPVSSSRTRMVPEISEEEESEEEQLLYRVPIFDPIVAELCSTSVNSSEAAPANSLRNDGSKPECNETGRVEGFLPSEMDLAEFAADVESLLGRGLEDEAFDIEGLGILDDEREREKERERECSLGSERVKVEDEEIGEVVDYEIDGEFIGFGRETIFELNFDYDEEDDKGKTVVSSFEEEDSNNKVYDAKKIFLRLDYQGVMSAWDGHKSPWTTGERPEFNPDQCWPDCTGTCGKMHVYGDMGMMSGSAVAAGGDGGREARVSRYREKRRTRLFSKKIRYEVRKLNAEKRPRMKGRFVKRASLVAPTNK